MPAKSRGRHADPGFFMSESCGGRAAPTEMIPQTPASTMARARIGTLSRFRPAMFSRESPTM